MLSKMDGMAVHACMTTAMAKGWFTPTDKVAKQMVCSLSFATPFAVQARNAVSSLSQSTKTSSRGKRDGPTINNLYTKKTRPELSQNFHCGRRKNNSLCNVEDGKEVDYNIVTNQEYHGG
jgi:hypothetical protein